MKRLILTSLSLLLVSTAAPVAAQAQVTPAVPPANAETIGMAVTPFNLVFLAYQGFFESEGIPKFSQLVDEYEQGNVTAESLVKVAIDMQRLTPETVNNRSYLAAVNHQLDSLASVSDD